MTFPDTKTRTLAQLAQEAIDVQDASNPGGLSRSYAQMITELHRLLSGSQFHCTRDLCRHPINQLWTSKLHTLAEMGLSDDATYGVAYHACQGLVAGKHWNPELRILQENLYAVNP